MSSSLHSRMKTKTYSQKLVHTHQHPQNTGPRKILKGIKNLPEGNKLPERREENETKKLPWQLRIRANHSQGRKPSNSLPCDIQIVSLQATSVLSLFLLFEGKI